MGETQVTNLGACVGGAGHLELGELGCEGGLFGLSLLEQALVLAARLLQLRHAARQILLQIRNHKVLAFVIDFRSL